MALEDLEKKLYREEPLGRRAFKNGKNQPAPPPVKEEEKKALETGWSEETLRSEKNNWKLLEKFGRVSRKLFWILIGGLVILMAIGGFYLYQYFTARDIVFSLKAPAEVMLGVPFDIEVNLQNNFNNSLNDLKLSIILPEGTAFAAESIEKRTLIRNFGNLEKNTTLQEKIPIIIFKNEQSLKRFEITASYFPPTLGPKARFEQTKNVEVAVRESGIKLDLIAPQKVLNNEDFEVEIRYQNISDIDFSGVELKLIYPDFFTFKSANISPAVGNNLWRIGDLVKDSGQKSLIISGSVISAEKSFFEIKGLLEAGFAGQKYLINEKTVGLNIAESPLFLSITSNGRSDYIAFPNDDLKYKISFRNNSDAGLNDVVIKAKLVGEMFNFQSLQTAGFFNSKDNTITWNAANTPALRLVAAGSDGFVEFQIKTKETYPIKRISDKNFILKVEAEISSPTVLYYVAADKTVGLAELKTKVAGKVVIDNFIDKGVLSPQVDIPAKFTIRWSVTNYSTDVRNVEVKAYLQSGARWTGQSQTNVSSTLAYNERTQEITWLIERIPATKGVVSKAAEAIFQIEVIPNITQVGQLLPLLSETSLRAIDEFVNIQLTSLKGPLTTVSPVIR